MGIPRYSQRLKTMIPYFLKVRETVLEFCSAGRENCRLRWGPEIIKKIKKSYSMESKVYIRTFRYADSNNRYELL